ncbi:MAG: AEC family transporter [Cohaesibacteraceae bacterium]|nr:AEC family transporter [Cohaesibacteraceae bacterium]MBL4875880.1 AEC family transporter [Cohaesibacteraceae bacterium]
MFDVFFNAVLPIFVVVAIGFAFARNGSMDMSVATGLNRFMFYFAVPILLFRLVSRVQVDQFEWLFLLAYFIAELTIYVAGYAIARKVFRRKKDEALLLGMAVCFSNHVFFVLPISSALFGEAATLPVVAIISLDAVVLFAGTILILETAKNKQDGKSLFSLLPLIAKNPQILAIATGVLFNFFDPARSVGFDLFTKFVGDAAAPCALFALGIILAQQRSQDGLTLPLVFAGLKLVAMPAIAWVLIANLVQMDSSWTAPTLLVAAGPAGAMPFVFALQYKIPVSDIAMTILLSTLGSLITVTLVGQMF